MQTQIGAVLNTRRHYHYEQYSDVLNKKTKRLVSFGFVWCYFVFIRGSIFYF